INLGWNFGRVRARNDAAGWKARAPACGSNGNSKTRPLAAKGSTRNKAPRIRRSNRREPAGVLKLNYFVRDRSQIRQHEVAMNGADPRRLEHQRSAAGNPRGFGILPL